MVTNIQNSLYIRNFILSCSDFEFDIILLSKHTVPEQALKKDREVEVKSEKPMALCRCYGVGVMYKKNYLQ